MKIRKNDLIAVSGFAVAALILAMPLSAVEGDGAAERPVRERAAGDGADRPPPPRGFVSRLDKDGDGKVSASEFDGPAEHFSHIDRDGDGFISESEAPTGPPPQRNADGPRGNGTDATRSGPPARGGDGRDAGPADRGNRPGFVARLDRDGDGKVSASEFDGPAEHFSHIDRDGDGFISESEAPTGPPPRGDRGRRGGEGAQQGPRGGR